MGRLAGFRYREVTRRLRIFGFLFDRPGSVWRKLDDPHARPRDGRPLRKLLPKIRESFVEAVLYRALRGRTGSFQIDSLRQ